MGTTVMDLEHEVGNFLERIRGLERRVEALEREAAAGLFDGTELVAPGAVRCESLNVGRVSMGLLGLGPALLVTIDSGEITITEDHSLYVVAAESGTTDDLDTINGGVEGDVIILFADEGDTITLTEDDNIRVYGTDDAVSGLDWEMLVFDGTYWRGRLMDVGAA